MKTCTEYFAREMTENPTPSEAKAKLDDPTWKESNNNWLNDSEGMYVHTRVYISCSHEVAKHKSGRVHIFFLRRHDGIA
jgi:hypothetical protein